MAKKVAVNASVDLNDFIDQAGGLVSSLAANTALIHNSSGKTVTFYCYNDWDVIYAVAYAKPQIADGWSGTVAAGGSPFKMWADNTGGQMLVQPRTAYVYEGPGKLRTVET